MSVTLTSVVPMTFEATGGRLLVFTGVFELGTRHNIYFGPATALLGTWTWDGTSVVLATNTSQVTVGDYVYLNTDGQLFKITSITANTSITIENLLELTIPSGATGSSFLDVSSMPKAYAGIPGRGVDVYPLNTTTMRAYTPRLTANDDCVIYVIQPDKPGTPNDVLGIYLEQTNPKNVTLNGIAYGNGVLVTVGEADGTDAYLLRSANNGVSWTEAGNPNNEPLNGVAYGNGVFVAVGDPGADAYLIRSVDDGALWGEVTNPKAKVLSAVAYGDGVFVAVGVADGADAYLLRSIDNGVSWSEIANPKDKNLYGVAYGNGVFIAVGDADGADAYLLRSIDNGATWSEIINPKNFRLWGVVYANGVFIAGGYPDGTDGYMIRSVDYGVSWSEVANPKNITIRGFGYGEGVFVASGYADGVDSYLLRSFDDGVSWTEVENAKNLSLAGIAYGNRVFVAVGDADGADAYMLMRHLFSIAKPHYKSSVFTMRSVLPPKYRAGPRNMGVLGPVS